MAIPTIKTNRLTLRAFTKRDIDNYTNLLNGEDILRYFPSTTPPTQDRVAKSITQILQHWKDRKYGLWAIALTETDAFIGRVGLQYLPETDEVEIDYILGRKHWGKGFATEAASVSLKYGFDNIDVDSIVGIVHPENLASQRVLQKIGMQFIEATEYFGMACHKYVKERV